jgi:hypothetical protein
MNHDRNKILPLATILIASAIVSSPSDCYAQRGTSGLKGAARPDSGWRNQRTSSSVRHARSDARGIYRYSRDAKQIEPAVAKSESEELGHNIAMAQKEIATARQEAGNDAKTLASLKLVEQHLTAAAEHYTMLHEECGKDTVDATACMVQCNHILLELDKAQAEHDALIRSLEINASRRQ